jgi:hypothetical protein
MKLPFNKVLFNGIDFIVMNILYKQWDIPILLNYEDGKYIKDLNKNWKCTDTGLVYCTHEHNGAMHEIYIHEVVMARKMKELGEQKEEKPIVHLNRIGIDNRRENLIYDVSNKDTNKNIKKKKRIIQLPEDSGIMPDDIPTYVWYLKPNDSHGERFTVEIGDVKWKTTSSVSLSLKYKLEEAKKFLRTLKEIRPELFEEYCMNGEYTKFGKELAESYFEIVQLAGYPIKTKSTNRLTDIYLKECTKKLTKEEKELLKEQKFENDNKKNIRRIVDSNVSKLKVLSMPKYCYYKKASSDQNRGDYFVVYGHPKQGNQVWQSSTSKILTTKIKFDLTQKYINELNLL